MAGFRDPVFILFAHPSCSRIHPFIHICDHPSVDPTTWVSVWQQTFVSASAFSRRAVVSYWRKYVHEVLVNSLGDLSLPRKNVVRLTDRPDMILDVYPGRKTTIQYNNYLGLFLFAVIKCYMPLIHGPSEAQHSLLHNSCLNLIVGIVLSLMFCLLCKEE